MLWIRLSELYGLKAGNAPLGAPPLMSVATLLCFDQLNIKAMKPYPSGEFYLTKKGAKRPLLVSHAPAIGVKDRRASIIHGHLCESAMQTWKIYLEDETVDYQQWCISGTGNYGEPKNDKHNLTPSVTPSNRPRISASQSFGIVHVDRKSQEWIVIPVPIRNGRIMMPNGQIITGNGKSLEFKNLLTQKHSKRKVA